MKIIIPMAGWGSRLRPHTLTIPKPMVPIAGKPIVQRLVEGLVESVEGSIEEINFIIRKEFGQATEDKLQEVARALNTKCIISYQESPEGTAHAIYCAKESLEGNVIVAFADTLFRTDFKIDASKDGVIWVNRVDDPKAFGVVKLNGDNVITDFIEKPQEFISDLAIIGIYYFKDGEALKSEIKHLLDNDIREKGEYQLTNALENLKKKGAKFVPGEVTEWLDCGNKAACIFTNERVLEHANGNEELLYSKDFKQTQIIEPCYIGKNVVIENAIIGPHVSVGEGSIIKNSIVKNSIIQTETSINGVILERAMIGNKVELSLRARDYSLGDYTTVKDE
ncbi:MAG: nucleotidyltransferase [Chitinophagales bacterium]|nr:nucleotidyltransferase [Chitinophagales bacterium]MDC3209158.1 sugar phosphate nucleotidyltransferase [Chitinophagales bacterium]